MRKEPLEAEAIPVCVWEVEFNSTGLPSVKNNLRCPLLPTAHVRQNGRQLLEFSAMFLQVYVNFFSCNSDKNVNRNNKCTVVPSHRTFLVKLLLWRCGRNYLLKQQRLRNLILETWTTDAIYFLLRTRILSYVLIQTEHHKARSWSKAHVTKGKMIRISSVTWPLGLLKDEEPTNVGH